MRGTIEVTGQIMNEVAQMILKHPDQLDLYEHFATLTELLKDLMHQVIQEKICVIDTTHFLMEQIDELKKLVQQLRNHAQQIEHGGNHNMKH